MEATAIYLFAYPYHDITTLQQKQTWSHSTTWVIRILTSLTTPSKDTTNLVEWPKCHFPSMPTTFPFATTPTFMATTPFLNHGAQTRNSIFSLAAFQHPLPLCYPSWICFSHTVLIQIQPVFYWLNLPNHKESLAVFIHQYFNWYIIQELAILNNKANPSMNGVKGWTGRACNQESCLFYFENITYC